MTLPKPVFPYIGRMYAAVVEAGINPLTLNRENADTLIRVLQRTNWALENADIINMRHRGGDSYGDMIKEVRAYHVLVNQVSRAERAAARAQEKAAAAATKLADRATKQVAKDSGNNG